MGFYEKYLCLCNSINKSPSAVALELKIGKPSVTRWKNGATPRDATVLKIADYFGVTVPELMAGVGEQEKAPATEGEGYDDKITRLYTQLPKLSDRQREMILGIVDEMLKNGEA
uniref:Helix-turn-helix domain protein n=1 Tax=Siphoviridae sp. ctjsp22 TaxID=2825636 RepID=A0A8S5V4X9_9CAUD|nr:MAG TPA: helix-turn-helix domain protein [Siphoviridae sp. ctjsp22]